MTDRIKALQTMGFIVGKRDRRLNTAFKGRYMVAQGPYSDADLPTTCAKNGPWCIVGNSLPALVAQAFDSWCES